jgi:hypothetical protein
MEAHLQSQQQREDSLKQLEISLKSQKTKLTQKETTINQIESLLNEKEEELKEKERQLEAAILKQKEAKAKNIFRFVSNVFSHSFNGDLLEISRFQLEYHDLEFGKVLGQGFNGCVRHARLYGTDVAVKSIFHNDQKFQKKFHQEIALMG